MESKKIFIFDTNFIVEIKDLIQVCESLKSEFDVYVTQVSIEERIGQDCRDLKKRYDEVNELQSKYKDIAVITLKNDYERRTSAFSKWRQDNYSKLFGENIIPYNKNGKMLSAILERANKKIPPFILEAKSDKGFKDALMWLSILDFFKSKKGKEIIFVSDDKGFCENSEFLAKEFFEVTGNTIQIKKNAYYKELIAPQAPPVQEKVEPLPDFSELRDIIKSAIEGLCYIKESDFYEGVVWYKTFLLSEKVDSSYIESIFSSLKNDIKKHIFEKEISVYDIFALDDRVIDLNKRVPFENFETALNIYEKIKNDYNQYLPQFYVATASIFNENYEEKRQADDDIPF